MHRSSISVLPLALLVCASCSSPTPQATEVTVEPSPEVVLPTETPTRSPTRTASYSTAAPITGGHIRGKVEVRYYLDSKFTQAVPVTTTAHLRGGDLEEELWALTKEGSFAYYNLEPGEYTLFIQINPNTIYFSNCWSIVWPGHWEATSHTRDDLTMQGYETHIGVRQGMYDTPELTFTCHLQLP